VVAAISDWPNFHLNSLRIHFVIVRMGAHEPNVDNPEIIVELNDQPVFVAANIENDPIAF
jgi:hypothetical protein